MNCIICGKEIDDSKYDNAPLCSRKCFEEEFWNQCLNDTAIVINGCCYHDGGYCVFPNNEKFLGFSGTLFFIKVNDGTLIMTNNLRYNGKVPKNRNVKDNAIFIKEDEYYANVRFRD